MNPHDDAPLSPVGPPARTDPDPGPTPAERRLSHLFRHSLRDGRLHPLYPLLRRYRQEGQTP